MAPYYKKLKPERARQAPKDPRHMGAKCDTCPLKESRPVYGDGPTDAKLAIVGDNPGKFELEAGIPFIGRAGEYIEDALKPHRLTRNEVLLTNAVLCFPPGGDMKNFLAATKKEFTASEKSKPAKERAKFTSPIDCCRPRLMYELGVPRCATCGKWDALDRSAVEAAGLPAGSPAPELPGGLISCDCKKPRWTKPAVGRVTAVLACGNAVLESLRGSDGVQAKQMYVFKNEERSK